MNNNERKTSVEVKNDIIELKIPVGDVGFNLEQLQIRILISRLGSGWNLEFLTPFS